MLFCQFTGSCFHTVLQGKCIAPFRILVWIDNELHSIIGQPFKSTFDFNRSVWWTLDKGILVGGEGAQPELEFFFGGGEGASYM